MATVVILVAPFRGGPDPDRAAVGATSAEEGLNDVVEELGVSLMLPEGDVVQELGVSLNRLEVGTPPTDDGPHGRGGGAPAEEFIAAAVLRALAN
eukprot:15453460-Alexandrium_andersonii.AAC.1